MSSVQVYREIDFERQRIMISAKKLNKSYGRHRVLDHLDLEVTTGSVLGFIGPNGAGKSTAMKIICGIFPPDSGEVTVSGIDMIADPVRAKENLGYLPENAPLYSGMSVAAFLRFCGRMRGLSGSRLKSSYERVVEICRLKDVLRMDVDSLSKGFRRRTCLAQSLIHSPENLVLDEPTDGLDPDQKREIRSLILELKKETAVIVSTHILEEIGAVCDHVLAIRQGRAVFYGTSGEFRKLSSEEGAVLLKLASGTDPAAFQDFPEASSLTFRKDGDFAFLKLYPRPGKEKLLSVAAVNFAAAQNIKILECEVLHADPGQIFAELGKEMGEKSC